MHVCHLLFFQMRCTEVTAPFATGDRTHPLNLLLPSRQRVSSVQSFVEPLPVSSLKSVFQSPFASSWVPRSRSLHQFHFFQHQYHLFLVIARERCFSHYPCHRRGSAAEPTLDVLDPEARPCVCVCVRAGVCVRARVMSSTVSLRFQGVECRVQGVGCRVGVLQLRI